MLSSLSSQFPQKKVSSGKKICLAQKAIISYLHVKSKKGKITKIFVIICFLVSYRSRSNFIIKFKKEMSPTGRTILDPEAFHFF
jgi:uncharacterized membrane protein